MSGPGPGTRPSPTNTGAVTRSKPLGAAQTRSEKRSQAGRNLRLLDLLWAWQPSRFCDKMSPFSLSAEVFQGPQAPGKPVYDILYTPCLERDCLNRESCLLRNLSPPTHNDSCLCMMQRLRNCKGFCQCAGIGFSDFIILHASVMVNTIMQCTTSNPWTH